MNNTILGQKIREQRLRLNISQEELGEKSDVTGAYIGQIERGERTPSIKRLNSIAKALKVNIDYFIFSDKIDLDMQIVNEIIGINEKQKNFLLEVIRLIKKYNISE